MKKLIVLCALVLMSCESKAKIRLLIVVPHNYCGTARIVQNARASAIPFQNGTYVINVLNQGASELQYANAKDLLWDRWIDVQIIDSKGNYLKRLDANDNSMVRGVGFDVASVWGTFCP